MTLEKRIELDRIFANIKLAAANTHAETPSVSYGKFKKAYIRARHDALTRFGIPQRIGGNRLGLRKRDALGYDVFAARQEAQKSLTQIQ